MVIQAATDANEVQALHLSAFASGENQLVARLAGALLAEESTPSIVNLVGLMDDTVVAHVAFSPVHDQSNKRLCGYILAPLAVSPDHQRQGLGSQLVREGLRQMTELAVDLAFVYGDPAYYGRFGFRAEPAKAYTPPHELAHPDGWLALELRSGAAARTPCELRCVRALDCPELW